MPFPFLPRPRTLHLNLQHRNVDLRLPGNATTRFPTSAGRPRADSIILVVLANGWVSVVGEASRVSHYETEENRANTHPAVHVDFVCSAVLFLTCRGLHICQSKCIRRSLVDFRRLFFEGWAHAFVSSLARPCHTFLDPNNIPMPCPVRLIPLLAWEGYDLRPSLHRLCRCTEGSSRFTSILVRVNE